MGAWLEGLVNGIFFTIDNIVYNFISFLFELLMYLANVNLFGVNLDGSNAGAGAAMITEFTSRIYVLLGIFMLFKVSFSILQYLVDPNAFSDKSKGMGKLITNVLVAMVLLVLTPSIFAFAYDIQGKLLSSNAISKLVLGNSTGGDTENIVHQNETLAKDMQFLVFGSFFTVNPEVFDKCAASTDENGTVTEPAALVLGTQAIALKSGGECIRQINDKLDEETNVQIGDFFRINDTDGRHFKSFGQLIDLRTDEDKFYFDYRFGISTIAGGFIVIMMLSYCIAVAVRILKLFFLQVIAPIPIISYVDPKQGKDGALAKWAKECGKTYISLFIRLALIFLAFYLIDLIASVILANDITYYNGDQPDGLMSVFVAIMLILGTLIFANQVPKLIEEIFNIKFQGEYTVNPLKKIRESPLASAAVGGAVGFAGGLAANGLNTVFKASQAAKKGELSKFLTGHDWGSVKTTEGFRNKLMVGGDMIRNLGRNTVGTSLGGAVGGAFASGRGSLKGDLKKGIQEGHSHVISEREARSSRNDQSLKTRVTNAATGFTGTKNAFGDVGAANESIQKLEQQRQNNERAQAALTDRLNKQINLMRQASASNTSAQEMRRLLNEFDPSTMSADQYIGDYRSSIEANLRNSGMSDAGISQYMSGVINEDAFNRLLITHQDFRDTIQTEKDLKKQIEDLQRAAGIKKDKK